MISTARPTIPSKESGFFFEIATLESLCHKHMCEDSAIRIPNFQIIWVASGSGCCRIDLERFPLNDNSILTIPPGRFHQLQTVEPVSGFVLTFNTDFLHLTIDAQGRPFLKDVISELRQAGMLCLNPANDAFESLLSGMLKEFDTCDTLRLEILSGMFRIFLIYLKRYATIVRQEPGDSHHMRLYNSFYTKLEKDYKTMRQVSQYANELSVTPSYLSEVVKRVTGFSASYHIQQRMVQEAKRLAMYSDANMKGVAYSLGFDDLSHFSKFFKHVTGVNFTEYKRSIAV